MLSGAHPQGPIERGKMARWALRWDTEQWVWANKTFFLLISVYMFICLLPVLSAVFVLCLFYAPHIWWTGKSTFMSRLCLNLKRWYEKNNHMNTSDKITGLCHLHEFGWWKINPITGCELIILIDKEVVINVAMWNTNLCIRISQTTLNGVLE